MVWGRITPVNILAAAEMELLPTRGNATLFDAVGDVADSVNLEAGSFAKGCFFGYLMGLFDSNGGTPNWMVFLLFPFNVPHSSPDSLNLIGDPGPIYSWLLDSFRQNTT